MHGICTLHMYVTGLLNYYSMPITIIEIKKKED